MLIADTTEIFSLLRQGGEIYVHERSKPMFIRTCDVARVQRPIYEPENFLGKWRMLAPG
jgi:hypothetical protein